MADNIGLPKISITVGGGTDDSTSGEINTLSVGYGIHQAWIYATMFGAAAIFQAQEPAGMVSGTMSSVSLVFIISLIVFALGLLFCSITDQKFLHFYVSRRLLVGAALLTFVGTLAVFGVRTDGPGNLFFIWFAALSTGIGSCLLLIFWATAYSRNTSPTIIINTAIAILIAIAIYSLNLHWLPFPYSGFITALLPLLEIPFLWQHTPIPYSQRHEVPIFNPLPIKRSSFFVRMGIPVFIFGFALGALRTTSIMLILPSNDLNYQMVIWLAAALATVLTLGVMLVTQKNGHWDLLFRALIPFIAVAIFALAFAGTDNSPIINMALLIGYMCFEALMWIFFGEVVQEFRISPIFTYGLGRGMLALGSLASWYIILYGPSTLSAIGIDRTGEAFFVLLAMVVAYALLPRQREIAAMISKDSPSYSIGLNNDISRLNRAADIEHLGGNEAPENDVERIGWFRARCEALADQYLLSRRELEVLFLLAKGHNASYIQDKLCISHSTAKTHINHIYRKLGIHSQQELLGIMDAMKKEDVAEEKGGMK